MFAVDALALLAGWAYWRVARATLRRGLRGDPHSVWGLPATAANPARAPLASAKTTGKELGSDLKD